MRTTVVIDDANLLLYAVDESSAHDAAAAEITGNLVPDAQLAALAIEHGVQLASADTDFMRFPGLGWINPLR